MRITHNAYSTLEFTEEPVANRGKSIENHPPVGGGRPNSKRRIDDDDSQDEQEDQDAVCTT